MRPDCWALRGLLASLACCWSIVWSPGQAAAQTTLNPDISLIGDARAFWTDDTTRVDADHLNLVLHEAELSLQGYLNPYARADAFFAWHGDESAEIEELYITFLRGLPLGLTVCAGQYLLDFGSTNSVHPHAWSFVERPLVHSEFFGHHGLCDFGVSASVALPTGSVATTLSADVLKGDFLAAHAHGAEDGGGHDGDLAEDDVLHDEPNEHTERPNERAFAARGTAFFALTDFTSLSVGASGLTGVPHPGERRWIGGADAKLRWKPSRYTSFTAVAEWVVRQDERRPERVTSHGLFTYTDYQFRQRYNVGAVGNWTEAAENSARSAWRVGAFGGFAPVEETSLLRLLVSYGEPFDGGNGVWSVILQLVFSLGPHKPHTF